MFHKSPAGRLGLHSAGHGGQRVGEQRDGAMSGARHGLQFYARCAREAWRRSWDAAKAWPPIAALLVLYGGARLAGVDLSFPGDGEHGAAIGTGLFIAIAWAV